MSELRIMCGYHQEVIAILREDGCYECPECHTYRQRLEKVDLNEELKRPEKAIVSERQYLNEARINLQPMDRVVMHMLICEDVRQGDALVSVPVRRSENIFAAVSHEMRPYRDHRDIDYLMGVALENTVAGTRVPTQLLSFYPPKENKSNWFTLNDCQVIKEVEDD